jgi:hypothetical protein
MRATPIVESWLMSVVPVVGSVTGMPSTRTSVCDGSAPRIP